MTDDLDRTGTPGDALRSAALPRRRQAAAPRLHSPGAALSAETHGAKSSVGARADGPPLASIDYGVLVSLVGFWIRRANIHVLRSFGRHLGDLDLRPVEVATLIILGSNAGLSQIALAAALGTDQSTLVGLLARLEERKLIDRKRLPADRRFHEVTLTRGGRAMVRSLETRLAEHDAATLRPLAAEERPVLISLLRRLLAGPTGDS
jgi:DNA-binding MarR family transcriptional regulator